MVYWCTGVLIQRVFLCSFRVVLTCYTYKTDRNRSSITNEIAASYERFGEWKSRWASTPESAFDKDGPGPARRQNGATR